MLTAVFLVMLAAICTRGMLEVGLMDYPGTRSSHRLPTPKGGGIGILAALLASWVFAGFPDPAVAIATAGLAAVALIDDLHDLNFAFKLGAQLAAALLVASAGFRVNFVATPWGMIDFGYWAGLVTVAWLLLVTNAVNFIDGLNGLASGTALIAALPLLLLPGPPLRWVLFGLTAGIIGFIPFNFPRARIFMGDVGSQSLGFVIGLAAIAAAQTARPGSTLLVPAALSLVLLDVLLTLARRAAMGRPLTEAHRSHVYQLANRSGWPATRVTLFYWAFAACAAAVAFATPEFAFWVILAAFLVWAGYVFRRARHLKTW